MLLTIEYPLNTTDTGGQRVRAVSFDTREAVQAQARRPSPAPPRLHAPPLRTTRAIRVSTDLVNSVGLAFLGARLRLRELCDALSIQDERLGEETHE